MPGLIPRMRLTQPQKAQRLLIAERRNMKKSRRARIRLQWRQALLKLLEHLLHIRRLKEDMHPALYFLDLNVYHLTFSSWRIRRAFIR